MQVPKRKKETYRRPQADPYVTKEKFNSLQKKLQILKTIKQPREAAEVKRLALMGDFSENTGYQLAKRRLRGINQNILNIGKQLQVAKIIPQNIGHQTVALGSVVSLETIEKTIKTYRLLGSEETNPAQGVISHNSPLGLAMMNRKIGEIIQIQAGNQIRKYKIIKIE